MKSSREELLDAVRDGADLISLLLKLRWFAEEEGVTSHRVQELVNNIQDERSATANLQQIFDVLDVWSTTSALDEIATLQHERDVRLVDLENEVETLRAELARRVGEK
jgi:hypothetical protein